MKRRVLVSLLAICLIMSPVSAFAQTESPNENAHSPEMKISDSLYEKNEIADEEKTVFEYDRTEQEVLNTAPIIGCEAAYVADPVSGKIFYEKNAHQKRYPASTTKILTALVVLENCSMDEMVKVSKSAIDAIPAGYSNAGLKVGEEQSVYTMLQALLIPSANEAAYALAEHVSGSVKAFADLCNKRAKELGCEKLHFVNPNGVHDNDHYCTAYDLYLIAKECQKYDVFNEIVKTTSFTVPASKLYNKADRTYSNTNELILPTSASYFFPYCTGIKTGHTTPAGECLVSSAEKDGLNLICVVLKGTITSRGVNERFYDSKKLMEFVYNKFTYKQIANKEKPLGQIEVKHAKSGVKTLDYYAASDLYSITPNSTAYENIEPEIEIDEAVKAPIKANQVLGTATYKIDGLIYSTNIIAKEDIEKKPYTLYFAAAGILIILIAAVVAIIMKKKKTSEE